MPPKKHSCERVTPAGSIRSQQRSLGFVLAKRRASPADASNV